MGLDRFGLCLFVVAGLGAPLGAQVLDLQPGRNYPWAATAFGGGLTESIAVGDADNDGDWDVAVANGGDGGPQANQLWINDGGAQGGVVGSFSDGTATRLLGIPTDTSRDIEFVDYDDDGDLDLFVGNRGTSVSGGEVSRAYRNQGGLQHGAVGYYAEDTDAFWGRTISVPPEQQPGIPDDFGPWLGQGRDVNFADLDDDGDLDLLHVTPGINMTGTQPMRIFLNDGWGRFDELYPWADDQADIELHSVHAEIADLDDDFDLDIFASSRDSQARVYRNELAQGMHGGRLFTDVTQTALIDTGAALQSSNNYEVALGDFDGDGDFDAWMISYDGGGNGYLDRVLVHGPDLGFARVTPKWIQGDPADVGNDSDVVDFDGDGDLDVVQANFGGENRLYVNALAQGVPTAQGLLHRSGAVAGLAPGPELPLTGNGFTSLDVDAVDLDGDGDPDLVVGNDVGQSNRLLLNQLGIPDSHAPVLHDWTDQPDKADGTPTPIHLAVRDNSPPYVVAHHRGHLFFSVDGGPETCVRLRAQSGDLFRAVIPAGLEGTVSYRAELTDENGNTLVTPTRSFVQTNPGATAVLPLGCGTPGADGIPVFEVGSTLQPGSPTQLSLRHAAPDAAAVLFLALQSTPVPFKQGTLHPFPVNVFRNRSTDAGGLDVLAFPWPDTTLFPTGLQLWLQYAVQDPAAAPGVSLSNAAVLEVL